jgi:hypothetical protein
MVTLFSRFIMKCNHFIILQLKFVNYSCVGRYIYVYIIILPFIEYTFPDARCPFPFIECSYGSKLIYTAHSTGTLHLCIIYCILYTVVLPYITLIEYTFPEGSVPFPFVECSNECYTVPLRYSELYNLYSELYFRWQYARTSNFEFCVYSSTVYRKYWYSVYTVQYVKYRISYMVVLHYRYILLCTAAWPPGGHWNNLKLNINIEYKVMSFIVD